MIEDYTVFAHLKIWLIIAGQILSRSQWLMAWNLFLAFIPLVLSIWLFRLSSSRSLLWWLILLAFIIFLPNASYILTDVIHLIKLNDYVRYYYSDWMVALVLIPQYLVFLIVGFEAYVISLINLGYFLHKLNQSRYITGMELLTHVLCSVGIYLGRFQRYNSWDFLTKPDDLIVNSLKNFTGKFPIFIMIVTWIVLTISYWIMKQVTLGLILRFWEVMRKE
jgi:uncharacterized membrane protein